MISYVRNLGWTSRDFEGWAGVDDVCLGCGSGRRGCLSTLDMLNDL